MRKNVLTNKEMDRINYDLIGFSKSEFLKNEINEAFFFMEPE